MEKKNVKEEIETLPINPFSKKLSLAEYKRIRKEVTVNEYIAYEDKYNYALNELEKKSEEAARQELFQALKSNIGKFFKRTRFDGEVNTTTYNAFSLIDVYLSKVTDDSVTIKYDNVFIYKTPDDITASYEQNTTQLISSMNDFKKLFVEEISENEYKEFQDVFRKVKEVVSEL